MLVGLSWERFRLGNNRVGLSVFILLPISLSILSRENERRRQDPGKSAQSPNRWCTILKGPFAKIGQMMPGRSLHQWNTPESMRKNGCFGRFWESALLLLWVSGVK